MVKTLKYDNPNKNRQIQVIGKSTGRTNNTDYEWYIGS